MVTNILRKTIKRDFPESSVLFSLVKEIRTSKQGMQIVVYRVEWSDSESKVHYFTFDVFSSALDFVKSNFQGI